MTAEEKLRELYKQRVTVQLTPKIIDLIANLVVERLKAPEVKHTPRDTSE